MRNDDLGKIVRRRIEGVFCLVAEKAKYHKPCVDRFRNIPGASGSSAGRPQNLETIAAFEKVCKFVEEDDDCQYTMKELLEIMGDHAYTEKHMKDKLEDKYGCGNVIFSFLRKVGTVVTF